MDIEASRTPLQQQGHNREEKMSQGLKKGLLIFNCFILILGNSGGPMMSRLYFFEGGKRQWLSSWLETGGWPFIFIPLIISYLYRSHSDPNAKAIFITLRLFAASGVLGLLTGIVDFIYAYGLSYIPVSTSALLISTQLAFTAFFAFIVVRQRFTPFSLNAVALLTVGAGILGLQTNADKPEGVTHAEYMKGFFMTLGAAGLYGFVLPCVELTYSKARQTITYTLVMEMQLVMAFFATLFCTVGMIVNHDFQAIQREASSFGLGEARYYVVLVWSAIFWQCFFLGTVGVIFCANTLLAGILIAVFIPVNEVLGVIFFREKFMPEKGIALVLSLWGLASYSYGEYKENKEKKEAARLSAM